MKNRIAYASCATLLCMLPSFVSAQDTPLPKEVQQAIGKTMIPAMLQETCAKKPFLIDDPDLQPAFRKRPINHNAVCKCFNSRVLEDARVKQAVQNGTIIDAMQGKDQDLEAHTKARFMQALMSCTAEEMDASLKANVPKH